MSFRSSGNSVQLGDLSSPSLRDDPYSPSVDLHRRKHPFNSTSAAASSIGEREPLTSHNYAEHRTTSNGPRKGLWHFISQHPYTGVAAGVGTVAATACFLFTWWLSSCIFSCPTWAVDCEVRGSVEWIVAHLGLVQGIVSFIYGLGLTSMAYTAYRLSEATLWPLLTRRGYCFRELDVFLSTTRGSVASLPTTLVAFKSPSALVVILAVAGVTVLLQLESIIVGAVYTRQNVTSTYLSTYHVGGGTGGIFEQSNPPGAKPAAMTLASSIYSSWAYGFSSEPMPLYREFIVDRSNLSQIGDIWVGAIRANKSIECFSQPLTIVSDVVGDSQDEYQFQVETSNSSEAGAMLLRLQAGLTLWVDNVHVTSNTRSLTTLVFVTLGGSIEGASLTTPTDTMAMLGYGNLSAISCVVDLELVDSEFSVGAGTETMTTISLLSNITGAAGAPGPLSQISVLLASAITGYGVSVFGAQPVFRNSVAGETYEFQQGQPSSLPVVYTSSGDAYNAPGNNWTIDGLVEFIDIGAGALGIALSRQFYHYAVNVTSQRDALRLEKKRSYILLAPIAFTFIMITILAAMNTWMYHSAQISKMQLVRVCDLVGSTQTAEMHKAAQLSRVGMDRAQGLEALDVRYGIVADGYAGLGTYVTPFSS